MHARRRKQIGRSTYGATKLRQPQRTEPDEDGLTKPHALVQTSIRRYRTQEVAGSSPASSIADRSPCRFAAHDDFGRDCLRSWP